jgi:membrane-associated phospholipid phosphatase
MYLASPRQPASLSTPPVTGLSLTSRGDTRVVKMTPPGTNDVHDPDLRGGLRLTLAALAGVILAIPFSLVLLLVVDHWGPLQRLDVRLEENLNAFAVEHASYVTVLRGISTYAQPMIFELVASLIGVALVIRRQPRLAAWLIVTIFGGELLSGAVKSIVGRKRPLVAHPLAHAVSASFPSGHALGSVVGVGALLLVGLPYAPRALRPALIALGVLLALAVGFSRLGLGAHYLSDVLGGYLLGAAWLLATTASFQTWRRERGRASRPITQGLEQAMPEDM